MNFTDVILRWRKPGTKEYTLFFEVQEQIELIFGDRGQNNGCLGGGWLTDWKGTQRSFWCARNILNLVSEPLAQVYVCFKTSHWCVHLICVYLCITQKTLIRCFLVCGACLPVRNHVVKDRISNRYYDEKKWSLLITRRLKPNFKEDATYLLKSPTVGRVQNYSSHCYSQHSFWIFTWVFQTIQEMGMEGLVI